MAFLSFCLGFATLTGNPIAGAVLTSGHLWIRPLIFASVCVVFLLHPNLLPNDVSHRLSPLQAGFSISLCGNHCPSGEERPTYETDPSPTKEETIEWSPSVDTDIQHAAIVLSTYCLTV